MAHLTSIAVFCGSSSGNDSIYREVAWNVGHSIALKGMRIIYGGSQIGLMGSVADGALSVAGQVIGVIPSFLKTKEIAHTGLKELMEVETMHERKMLMHELSDAIIALPGGFGTMEELFEMLTWAQLGLHKKPIGILNIAGFYDGLLQLIRAMVEKAFLSSDIANMLIVSDDIDELLVKMANYEAPIVPKWITENRT